MKKIYAIGLAVAFLAIFQITHSQNVEGVEATAEQPVEVEVIEEPTNYEKLTHAQETWLRALEWCESAGKKDNINKVDRDGTPSYYSFQFKPSTFKGLALKYKVLPSEQLDTNQEVMQNMKDYSLQREIVSAMILDPKTRWSNEFPDCTGRKIGLPPRY